MAHASTGRARTSAGARDLLGVVVVGGLVGDERRQLRLGVEVGTGRTDGLDGTPAMDLGSSSSGSSDPPGPGAPGAGDAAGGIGEDAVEIEQEGGEEG